MLAPQKSRAYTPEEKEMYASILGMAGYNVTDAELAKRTTVVKTEKHLKENCLQLVFS